MSFQSSYGKLLKVGTLSSPTFEGNQDTTAAASAVSRILDDVGFTSAPWLAEGGPSIAEKMRKVSPAQTWILMGSSLN